MCGIPARLSETKMKILTTIAFIVLLASFARAQNCTEIEDCQNKLGQASQMINKLLDVSKSQQDAIQALQAETASRVRKSEIDTAIIANQDRLILLLEKNQRRKFSVLWGIISVRF